MVAFAPLDEAFNSSDMTAALKKQHRDLSSAKAPTVLATSDVKTKSIPRPNEMVPSSSSQKKLQRKQHQQQQRLQQLNHKASAPTALKGYDAGAPAYAASAPDASDCLSYYRGCNLDDVENVMDFYTSEPQVKFEKETRHKVPDHKLKACSDARNAHGSMMTVPSQTASARKDSGSPMIYDGMSPVDLPYCPYVDQDNIAAHAAVYSPHGGPLHDASLTNLTNTSSNDAQSVSSNDSDAGDDGASSTADGGDQHTTTSSSPTTRKKKSSSSAGAPTSSANANESASAAGHGHPPSSSSSSPHSDGTNSGAVSTSGAAKSAHDRSTSYILEIALYIITGVLLIFVMDQFVQIGAHMGRASAFY